ncbi:hypothetical protein [Pseudoxanthomonas winnipegensis]|uniref:hypothetical protein n=1 Tax=Pseudoxanthomonas winnipegensis TaxID=2480810 RepID=UPI00102DF1AC|nr:hypothetical protein [Pseudoxanthomonas winnipegensis]RZZ85652.1 hypothetical protein EA663_11615 [Pseudoxanthomonas winnipegensis]
MNAVVPFQPAVEAYGARSLTAADVRAQVNLMQDVMAEVMKDGTHYGTIPGTKSKSLYKAGAEKLMATFRLAAKPEVEDLSAHGEIAYRVTVNLLSANGNFIGAGIGECSSAEDKYSWRAAVCDEEFDETPENRRRVKFSKYQGKVEKKKQVRTNPADVANTILKMAKKRAQVDAVITATAASDIFTQDIEDLPDEVVAEIVGKTPARQAAAAAAVQQATPEDSPERDAAIAAFNAAAAKGTEHFREFWKQASQHDRGLVRDRVSSFQEIAQSADKMQEDA